jgi:hypothetical protein
MDAHTKQEILDTFMDADLSIVQEILFFDGWTSYEEHGGYLIFRGIDGSIQRCEYGHSVMDDHDTNHFCPMDITDEEFHASVAEMEEAAQNTDFV